MQDLTKKKCVPCGKGTKPIISKDQQFKIYHDQLSDWKVIDKEKKITKKFEFKNFTEALKFVYQVGKLAELENHHPNIYLYNWNKVKIIITTHAIGGLSVNDFILAAKINQLQS